MSQSNAKVMLRRSTVEMDIAVLQALSGFKTLKLTHIMYKANLNANVLKEKLIVLESKGLIKSHRIHKEHLKAPGKERMFYALTSKGVIVLHSYLSVIDALGVLSYERS
jgi:predicted transcriptional regulator